VLLFVDIVIVPELDLRLSRDLTALLSMVLLLFGLRARGGHHFTKSCHGRWPWRKQLACMSRRGIME
jgi:hypothetical protein